MPNDARRRINLIIPTYIKVYQVMEGARMPVSVKCLVSRLDSLDTMNHGRAARDDAYIFAQDRNQDYIDSNTTDRTMINAGLNLTAIIDSSGQTIFINTLETDTQTEVTVISI
jgi:sensor domain CHASE-containing protein